MPIDENGVVTVEEAKPFHVKLLRGPLGGRHFLVPAGVATGFKIVVGRDGLGQEMRPCLYELDLEHASGKPIAFYAGLADVDDVEGWRAAMRAQAEGKPTPDSI